MYTPYDIVTMQSAGISTLVQVISYPYDNGMHEPMINVRLVPGIAGTMEGVPLSVLIGSKIKRHLFMCFFKARSIRSGQTCVPHDLLREESATVIEDVHPNDVWYIAKVGVSIRQVNPNFSLWERNDWDILPDAWLWELPPGDIDARMNKGLLRLSK